MINSEYSVIILALLLPHFFQSILQKSYSVTVQSLNLVILQQVTEDLVHIQVIPRFRNWESYFIAYL